MSCQKYLLSLGTLLIALCVELVTFSFVTPQVRAQSLEFSVTFPPTEDVGAPDRTGGGGTRSPEDLCVQGTIPLTVLAPTNNVGTTVSANPTLFWYVPQTKANSAEFVLHDNQYNEVFRTTLALNGSPGVVKVSLPTTVSLETGKDYQWELGLICNPENQSLVSIRGVIQRTELSSAQKTKLAAATEPLTKAQVYAEAKVWQETLAILAQLRHQRPNDSTVTDAWKELLNSVDLQAIATAPLLECCTAGN